MRYISSVERIGYKRGFEEGFQLGLQQGLQLGLQQSLQGWKQVFILQAEARFGRIPKRAKEKIDRADMDMIKKWSIRLLKADSLKSVLNETDGM